MRTGIVKEMYTMIKRQITIVTLCLSLFALPALAAKDASQANAQQSAAIQKLLAEAQKTSQPGAAQRVAQQTSTNSSAQQHSSGGANNGQSQKAANGSQFGNTGVSQEAFAKMIRNLMPLTPDQIRTLRYLFDQSKRAATTYPGGTPPKPTSSSAYVNLDPGATPPVVRLRKGFVTSLVFVDATGAPWPIKAYDLGNPQSFNIQWDQKGNTLLVQAMDSYKTGNLAVILKGQNTPVMITLVPGQKQVDYRVDLRLPGLGPNASPITSGLPNTGDPKLLSVLNGIPPQGAKELEVEGGPVRAWAVGNKIFLRTRLTVLSPSWVSTMSSPDGMNVYEITRTPVVLASHRGKIVQLTIQGL